MTWSLGSLWPSRLRLPGRARAIKRRLLDRVADDDDSHVTVRPDDGVWWPLRTGVRIKVLHRGEGVQTYLLRMQPGARLPAHRHPVDEECLVLEGTLWMGERTVVGPGSYHFAHRGALHPSICAPEGATLFLRGAAPSPDQVLE